MSTAEQDRDQRWLSWIAFGLFAAIAVLFSAGSPMTVVIEWWVIVGVWAWIMFVLPLRQSRQAASAARAQLLALDRLA